jgi:hypothetical protein
MMVYFIIWLVVEPYPSEKYAFVTWDDEIPNLWKSIKVVFQTTNTLNKTIWVIRIGDPNWGPTSRKG